MCEQNKIVLRIPDQPNVSVTMFNDRELDRSEIPQAVAWDKPKHPRSVSRHLRVARRRLGAIEVGLYPET